MQHPADPPTDPPEKSNQPTDTKPSPLDGLACMGYVPYVMSKRSTHSTDPRKVKLMLDTLVTIAYIE